MQACHPRIAALLWSYISKGVSEIMRKGLINDLRSILPVMYGYEEDGLACCWHLGKIDTIEGYRSMRDPERIKLLEKALIKYVELYGFIDEAREYYIRNADGEGPGSKQKH